MNQPGGLPPQDSLMTGQSSQVRDSLKNLDDVQQQTMVELDFYNQQQRALKEKLRQQEELLALVQKDIDARENLIEDVFKERVDQHESS